MATLSQASTLLPAPSQETPAPPAEGTTPSPSSTMAPPPGGAPSKAHPEKSIAQNARLSAYFLVALLIVTTACFSAYVGAGLKDSVAVLHDEANGQAVHDNATLNTTLGPLTGLPPDSLIALEVVAGLGVMALLWISVVVTSLAVFRPASLANPAKLLDVFYMNMLFGLVFWPLAALGALLPDSVNLLMVGLGLIPALVLTITLGRFVEEGLGNKILFLVILGSISVLMICIGIAWGVALSGGLLYLVALLQVVPLGIFMVRALRDRTDPIRTRPLVSEMFLWSAIGVILSTAVGVVASGGFTGIEAVFAVVASLFTGTTPLLAPFNATPYLALTGASTLVTTSLPVLFGVLGVLSAAICLVPLMQVGDLYLLRTGQVEVATCPRCHRTHLVLKVQEGRLCNRCRARNPQAPQKALQPRRAAGPPTLPPPPA